MQWTQIGFIKSFTYNIIMKQKTYVYKVCTISSCPNNIYFEKGEFILLEI